MRDEYDRSKLQVRWFYGRQEEDVVFFQCRESGARLDSSAARLSAPPEGFMQCMILPIMFADVQGDGGRCELLF